MPKQQDTPALQANQHITQSSFETFATHKAFSEDLSDCMGAQGDPRHVILYVLLFPGPDTLSVSAYTLHVQGILVINDWIVATTELSLNIHMRNVGTDEEFMVSANLYACSGFV